MTGFIHIEVMTHEGQEVLSVETHVQDVETMDVIQVLDSVCQALRVPDELLQVFAGLRSAGILDNIRDTVPLETSSTTIEFDVEGIKNQLKKGRGNSEG